MLPTINIVRERLGYFSKWPPKSLKEYILKTETDIVIPHAKRALSSNRPFVNKPKIKI
jgi:hypothetical protein